MNPFKNVAIVGVYTTEQGVKLERSTMDLFREAFMGALADAGLEKKDVDGIAGGVVAEDRLYSGSAWAEQLGIPIKFFTDPNAEGATHVACVIQAAAAIATGLATTVVIPMATGKPAVQRDLVASMAQAGDEFTRLWGSLLPGFYAMAANRHMHEYGTTPEQMAEVAVAFRKHASLNPEAIMRKPITVQDVLNSPMVADPLHLLDCCLISRGAGALVMTTAERAGDCRRKPVFILGAGEEHTHNSVYYAPSLITTGAVGTGKRAFGMAGLTPNDIDYAGIYDCFTITVLVELEDLGFCKKGEGGPFVEGGTLQLGGKLPCNTDGGMLSHSHIGLSGLFHVIEAVRQLRGECGDRQVPNARIAIAHNNGSRPFYHETTVIMGRE